MTGEEANNANDPQHVTDTSDDPASGQVPAQHHATPLSAPAQSADTEADTSASTATSTTAAHDGNTHTAQVEEQLDGTKPAAKPVFSAFDMSSLPDLRDPSSRGGADTDTPSSDGQTPMSATRNTDARAEAEDQSRAEFTTVYDIIDSLEQQLDEAKSSIFTPSQVRIDRDAFASQLDELKAMLPVQLERASALMREAERRLENAQTQANAVVSSAQSRAADIVRDAQEQAQFLAGQDNITNIAKQKARAILDQAQTQADKLTSGANQYCTDVMQSLQDQLDKLSQDVRGGLTVLDQREREASARLDHIQSDDYPEA